MLRTADKRLFVGGPLSAALGPGTLQRAPRPTVPPLIPTLAWYDASDLDSLTLDGDVVTTWGDKSGNGFDLSNTQGKAALMLDRHSGRPVVCFGTGQSAGLPYFSGSASRSDRTSSSFVVAMVFDLAGSAAHTLIGCATDGGNQFRMFGSFGTAGQLATTASDIADLASLSTPVASSGVPFVAAQILSATQITHYLNASSETDSNSSTFTDPNLLKVGLIPTGSDLSPLRGWIGEIRLFDTTLSTNDAEAQIDDLMSKWAIA